MLSFIDGVPRVTPMSTTYHYHAVKRGTRNIYEVTRSGETKPFAVVRQVSESSWNSSARWTAANIDDETVTSSGTSRANAVSSLEWRILPQEERDRRNAEGQTKREIAQREAAEAARQRKLAKLRSPEHQAEALTEAFHVLFDIKEAAVPGSIHGPGQPAWNAIQALRTAMEAVGIEVPVRFDGDERPL